MAGKFLSEIGYRGANETTRRKWHDTAHRYGFVIEKNSCIAVSYDEADSSSIDNFVKAEICQIDQLA